jgi:hypothetical protein
LAKKRCQTKRRANDLVTLADGDAACCYCFCTVIVNDEVLSQCDASPTNPWLLVHVALFPPAPPESAAPVVVAQPSNTIVPENVVAVVEPAMVPLSSDPREESDLDHVPVTVAAFWARVILNGTVPDVAPLN